MSGETADDMKHSAFELYSGISALSRRKKRKRRPRGYGNEQRKSPDEMGKAAAGSRPLTSGFHIPGFRTLNSVGNTVTAGNRDQQSEVDGGEPVHRAETTTVTNSTSSQLV